MTTVFYPEAPIPAAAFDTSPGSTKYDPATRDYRTDSSGNYRRVHWVDQAVSLALSVRRGSIAGAPEIGNTLGDVKLLPANPQSDAQDRVNQALATLLAAPPKVEVVSVDVDTRAKNQYKVAVTYKNLLTGRIATSTNKATQ